MLVAFKKLEKEVQKKSLILKNRYEKSSNHYEKVISRKNYFTLKKVEKMLRKKYVELRNNTKAKKTRNYLVTKSENHKANNFAIIKSDIAKLTTKLKAAVKKVKNARKTHNSLEMHLYTKKYLHYVNKIKYLNSIIKKLKDQTS